MGTFRSFEEIEAWKTARILVRTLYAYTNRGEFARDYALRDQVRRAAVSVMANIAEGFERNGNREFIQFLSIAKGSIGEVRSLLYVAADVNYISAQEHEALARECRRISAMLQGLTDYLQMAPVPGTKFRDAINDGSSSARTLKP